MIVFPRNFHGLKKFKVEGGSMRKFYLWIFLLITFTIGASLKGQPVKKFELLNISTEALIDSVRNVALSETNIEVVENKAFLYLHSLQAKKEAALPDILEVIKDPQEDWKLRFVAVEMIPQISKAYELAEELAKILRNEREHPYLRGVCALSLGYMGRKEYVPLLIQNLKDKSVYVRERTIWGLGLLRDLRAIQPLIECLDDSYYMVQVLAIQTLGRLEAKEAMEPLKRKLDADDFPQYPEIIKHKVVRAITSIGGPEARAVLINVLTDEGYAELRLTAADGLGNYKDEEVIKTLLVALNDWDELLRLHAAKSLFKIAPEKAVSAIENTLPQIKSEYVKTMLQKLISK